jgi:hypothetical protein
VLRVARQPLLKMLGPATVVVMIPAVVATANHYLLGAAAGAAPVFAALALVSRVGSRDRVPP